MASIRMFTLTRVKKSFSLTLVTKIAEVSITQQFPPAYGSALVASPSAYATMQTTSQGTTVRYLRQKLPANELFLVSTTTPKLVVSTCVVQTDYMGVVIAISVVFFLGCYFCIFFVPCLVFNWKRRDDISAKLKMLAATSDFKKITGSNKTYAEELFDDA